MSISLQTALRQTRNLPTKQRQQQQFKQTDIKILSYRTTSSTIEELLQNNSQNKNYSSIQEIRIMHSQYLTSLKGIQIFKNSLKTLNLSSNTITSIQGIEHLSKLETLEIRNNKLQSLKGIEKCINLIKIDASNNQLTSFQGLKALDRKNKISIVFLAGNFFEDLRELQWLQKCKQLQELNFIKGKSSNPFCQNYGDYIFTISEMVSDPNVAVDDQKLSQHMKYLEDSNNFTNQNSHQNHIIQNISYQNSEKRSPMLTQLLRKPSNLQVHSTTPFQRTPSSMNNQQLFFTQQQQQLYQQTEEMLMIKNQQIQDLKHKTSQLQIQQSTQYKQLIKKETELERLEGQNRQLQKQVDKKEKTLSEMHKRIEDLLKSSTERNKIIEAKNSEIDHLKEQINELKIESAEHKALSKDYERRLSQLHEKTLTTIEERTLKQDEMKRKYEELYGQNYKLCKQKQEMKDRLRELTEMLREWEFKYEGKVNELQAKHALEREELLKEAEQKISLTTQHYEHQLQRMDEEMRTRVEEIENTYKSSLQEGFEKHKKLKSAYEERTKNEQQTKVFLKSALEKNQEQESLIQEFQEIVIKLKGQLASTYEDKQHAQRELNQLRYRQAHQMASIEQKTSKLQYEKNKFEKQLLDLKETHSSLLSENESQAKYQKIYEELESKFEDLQITLDAKQQQLEDKNDTIQNLKQQIEALQREGSQKVDQKEFENLRKKYDKYKKENQQFKEQTASLIQENDELRKQNEDCKEVVAEFETMKETLAKYQKIVLQKDAQLQQLAKYFEDLNKVTISCKQEVEQWKRQYGRLETESLKKERELREQLREIELRHKRELDNMKIENEKYRKNALEQLQSVFMKLQK